jgi:hypothetical protein
VSFVHQAADDVAGLTCLVGKLLDLPKRIEFQNDESASKHPNCRLRLCCLGSDEEYFEG